MVWKWKLKCNCKSKTKLKLKASDKTKLKLKSSWRNEQVKKGKQTVGRQVRPMLASGLWPHSHNTAKVQLYEYVNICIYTDAYRLNNNLTCGCDFPQKIVVGVAHTAAQQQQWQHQQWQSHVAHIRLLTPLLHAELVLRRRAVLRMRRFHTSHCGFTRNEITATKNYAA